ncbi:aspartyl-phosphate phosphatase Spo0E family protein [Paenibacillus polymyxa]|uniref:aspartyl-phosphate phosphatase Spo0E family protein n=1 Tax=Paenibacillus polymyxa TaxID=1406 RepID=UPI0025B62F7E|nr:aspartyl-phosphate phosphatase Spo0E family protein [Paenibacillus polymyxa]MDN4106438.1 aspartyl-phosphate phosphatase Spo0E family protein [Paenibacillus polymyxa]
MNIDESLTKQMESARQRLHDLYKQYGGFGHACVLEQSMILDELINQYNRMYQTKELHHNVQSDPQSKLLLFPHNDHNYAIKCFR